MCLKGDQTAQNAETQQLGFTQQLMNLFQAQYGKQGAILDYLTKSLEPRIANPQGYTPAQLAAQRTGATDTIAQQTQNAEKAMNATAIRAGGAALPSGVSAQLESGAAVAGAEEQAQAQNQITQANANLQQQNYWNSIQALTGIPQINPLSGSSSVNQGFGNIAPLSQAVTQAQGPGIGQILGGIATGALGAAGTAFGGGSLGKIFGPPTTAQG